MLVCSLDMQGRAAAVFGFRCCDLFLWFFISSLLLLLFNPGERTMLLICSLLTTSILFRILIFISVAQYFTICIANLAFYTLFWYRRNRLLTALKWLAFTIWILAVLLLFIISIGCWFWPIMLVVSKLLLLYYVSVAAGAADQLLSPTRRSTITVVIECTIRMTTASWFLTTAA